MHEETKAYASRRLREGRTKLEILRCLKRYIAREVFKLLNRCAVSVRFRHQLDRHRSINAVAESFFATLEGELIARTRWRTRAEARRDVFAFIETWYNGGRRHSTLGYRSPATYEKEVLQAAA
jgi:transposase InsO family protein